MSESVYKPKQCAFHPKETIFNFCKNLDCLLPLCPTCVDLHTEEHKQQKTYGKFENIHQVVNEISFNLESNVNQLESLSEDVKEQVVQRTIDEQALRRQIGEAKERVIGLVERFFDGFEKQVNKSIAEFNVSLKQNYRDMETQIKTITNELKAKNDSLAAEKVLKTVIAYFSKGEQEKTSTSINTLREDLEACGNKKMEIIMENNSIQRMVNQMSQFMYLNFQNWEQDVKYSPSEFIKTGFSHRTSNSATLSPTNSI